jgi:CheY-like chemotaxis protein
MPARLTLQSPADNLLREDNLPTLLIVDDDGDIRRMLSSILPQEYPALRVLSAATSQQALDIAAHTRPDLLLLDYCLLGSAMNGIELHDALQACYSEKIPTIMVSAGAPLGDLASRCIPLVSKPFNLELLLEHIAALLMRAPVS